MAISRKMLEVIQKVDAAHQEFLNGLRESVKREARRRAKLKWATTMNRKPPTKSALVREASPARKRRAG